jgi:hypothetical protein
MLPVATLQLAGGLHIQNGDLHTRKIHQQPITVKRSHK